jgi:hypothetical protein
MAYGRIGSLFIRSSNCLVVAAELIKSAHPQVAKQFTAVKSWDQVQGSQANHPIILTTTYNHPSPYAELLTTSSAGADIGTAAP